MIENQTVIDHVAARIDAAAVVEEPFPHLVVRDLLPVAAYRAVLDAWPADAVFQVNGSMQRHDVTLRGAVEILPEAMRPFWRQALTWTMAANQRLAAKFAPYAALKYEPFLGRSWRQAVAGLPRIVGEAQLACYTGATGLAPHIDHPKLITNGLLYCSELAEDEPELGTVLYGSRGFSMPDNALRLTPALIERLLRRNKTVAYAANVCLAYLNTPRSFHGVDPVDLGARRRRLLMFGTVLREKDTVRLFGAPFAAET